MIGNPTFDRLTSDCGSPNAYYWPDKSWLIKLRPAPRRQSRPAASGRDRRLPGHAVAGRPRIAKHFVTRYAVARYGMMSQLMAEAAARMKAMRERRRARGLRELRLIVPDAREKSVRRRVAKEVAGLNQAHELDAMRWIEAVSEFDAR